MKLKAIKSALLVAAFAVAGNAQAAIDLPNTDVANTGGSELVLAVQTTSQFYTLDLGIGFGDITTSSSYDFAPTALLQSILGDVQSWMVFASDSVQAGQGTDTSTWGRRVQLTSGTGAPVNADSFVLAQQTIELDGKIGLMNGLNSHDSAANGESLMPKLGGEDVIGNTAGLNGSDSVIGSLGDTLSYYTYTETGTVISTPRGGDTYSVTGVDVLELGTWTLSQNGLSFEGSEVPVPAAVWLFGSAMLGLVGVSRRK